MMLNDKIRIAVIGPGGMGQGDAHDASLVPGVEIAAAADIYDSRLDRMKETYPHIITTRDYRELLARTDIDAVIIATPDHWHSKISIDALNAGKDVYCEKPMVQKIEQGHQVIDAWKKSGRIFQMGSQYASAHAFQKIRKLLAAGAIGELNSVEAWLDRNTAMGAWQYSIPPDASPANIDWDTFLGSAPKRPFEPIRLFRWRICSLACTPRLARWARVRSSPPAACVIGSTAVTCPIRRSASSTMTSRSTTRASSSCCE